MTVEFHVGRRVPRNWYKRTASKIKGLLTYQENIWQIICSSLSKAMKKANSHGGIVFKMSKETEPEDLHYQLEWRKIKIVSTPEMEEDEYNDILNMYKKLGKVMKKDFDKDDRMSKHFKTKILTSRQVSEAYTKGYGAIEDNNIANKLLEMGILTHVEWIKDFDEREDPIFLGQKTK